MNCEIEDTYTKEIQKSVTMASVVIAICVIIGTVLFICSIDIMNYFDIGKKPKKKKKSKSVIQKGAKYIPFKFRRVRVYKPKTKRLVKSKPKPFFSKEPKNIPFNKSKFAASNTCPQVVYETTGKIF
jgi:heme/copper-type cytochrome/quinol oxidase subunit 2